MQQMRGASTLALAHRFVVLVGLIARAAGVYARIALDRRGLLRSSEASRVEQQARLARRFVTVASRFRGGLIKLGQVASLRVDVLPDEVTDELIRLQDRVEPHPYAEIAAQIEAELGAAPEIHFAEFETEPIASASLGQVHRARAGDGSALAVKILYPGIERSVAVDLAGTRIALWLFNFLTVADLTQVYREIRTSLQGEMDYLREGRAAEEVARNLAQDPEVASHVRVPKIHWESTTRRVLSMEFLEGCKINDTAALERWGIDRHEVVLWASRAFLHMMFRDGFFHCDPHPGNLLVGRDGRIGIVDFGMNQRMPREVRSAIRKNVLASVARDADLYAESLLDIGVVRVEDLPAVKEVARISFDPAYFNLTPQEMARMDLGEYFKRMRVQMKRIKSFQLPEGIVMWSRAITLLYGLAAELAPGLRPLDVIGPYVAEFLRPEESAS